VQKLVNQLPCLFFCFDTFASLFDKPIVIFVVVPHCPISFYFVFIFSDAGMEKALKKEVDEVLSQPSVTGLLCVDSDGLCVTAHGSASKTSSGLIAAVASQAAALRPNAPMPVVVLETEGGTTLIKSHSGTTVAINKTTTMRKDVNSTAAAEVNR